MSEPHPAAPSPGDPSSPAPASPARAPDPSPAPPPANQLTPEEQMALYEKELKETDWGHQPC